ncbi:T9SS type A sorting domain-containing protein [Polaribacter sp. Q13]|uniref:T9SS type A sorting domain-containing protein n=1 Tax=Polaribacter sp. Q13 TaxID=2806551 RepID=UPI00207884C9|nr:T9SS type A sorting domain-containing protein [Polaribacter sp. Q13]
MMKNFLCLVTFLILISQTIFSQVLLSADGLGNTYELINAVLANPNRSVVETPDCSHTDFGNHIDEVFDTELNKNVFRFHIHVSLDNDRCKKFDRQRNEIKTYADSPENLKATKGETVAYKWKFKLSNSFKPSSSFTHIHQLKVVGGPYASIPMISFTLRKGKPDKLELRYTATKDQNTLKTVDLNLLKGKWLEVTEYVKFDDVGSYSVEIKTVSNNKVIFNYANSPLDTWQDGAEFARPKWGIYRSLNNKEDLQDEIVKFADFSIQEITSSLSVETLKEKASAILLFPNPASEDVEFKNVKLDTYDLIEVYDYSGRKISTDKKLHNDKLNVSGFSKGLYFIVFKKDAIIVKVLKCYVK